MTALARISSNYKTELSSRQGEYYIKTISENVQLENKVTGRESERACRQNEMIGGKPPVVK
jgi:hypothetical protein